MSDMQVPLLPAEPKLAPPQRVIVVGYDGGPPARRALAWAARRAGPGGRLILVSATHAEPGALGRPGLDMLARNSLDHARLVLDELALDGAAPDIDVVIADETPSRALARVARQFGADEIAIGGRAGHGDGDVAADLLSAADRPVVVVR